MAIDLRVNNKRKNALESSKDAWENVKSMSRKSALDKYDEFLKKKKKKKKTDDYEIVEQE